MPGSVHSSFCPPHPLCSSHSHSPWSPSHSWRQPGAHAHWRASSALLGRDRQHVHRQLHSSSPEPALCTPLCQYFEDSQESPIASRDSVLCYRDVHSEQFGRRYLDDAPFWRSRVLCEKTGL